jgi:Protein of unknown function (DUF1194)
VGKHGQYRSLVAAVAAALAATPAGAGCRLALALGFDVSRSISTRDYRIQQDGIVAALTDAGIRAAFLSGPDPVALAIFEWSGSEEQALVLDWMLVRGQGDLDRAAAAMAGHDRQAAGLTALGVSLLYAGDLMARAPACDAQTLDLSGDGQSNAGPKPHRVYAGRDFGALTVNALAIDGDERDLVRYLSAQIIRGPGAFVEVADGHEDFPRAFRRKLERELSGPVLGSAGPAGADLR